MTSNLGLPVCLTTWTFEEDQVVEAEVRAVANSPRVHGQLQHLVRG